MHDQVSVIPHRLGPVNRSAKKVPFVELLSGRVQGVVSSGSDIKRVYVSYLESETGNFYCCTNNNRPCGGMRGSPCKHIRLMLDEAALQFGFEEVARYLGVTFDGQDVTGDELFSKLVGVEQKESPGIVFSRFLNYLRFVELESKPGIILEMDWFVS